MDGKTQASGRLHLTTGQAAAYLGVSTRALLKWADKELVPHFRLPTTGTKHKGHVRFDRKELALWMLKAHMPVPEELLKHLE